MGVSGLVSRLDSQPGSELPFATTIDQIELLRSLWSRFWLPFAKHVDQIELRGGLWSRS